MVLPVWPQRARGARKRTFDLGDLGTRAESARDSGNVISRSLVFFFFFPRLKVTGSLGCRPPEATGPPGMRQPGALGLRSSPGRLDVGTRSSALELQVPTPGDPPPKPA